MITLSAVRCKLNGRIYCGENHSEAYRLLLKDMSLPSVKVDHDSVTEGYITDYGVFLNRVQAYYEAERHNQLLKPSQNKTLSSDIFLKKSESETDNEKIIVHW